MFILMFILVFILMFILVFIIPTIMSIIHSLGVCNGIEYLMPSTTDKKKKISLNSEYLSKFKAKTAF